MNNQEQARKNLEHLRYELGEAARHYSLRDTSHNGRDRAELAISSEGEPLHLVPLPIQRPLFEIHPSQLAKYNHHRWQEMK